MSARLLLLLPLIAVASAFVVLSLVSGSAVTESAAREGGLRQRSGHPLKDPKLSSALVALADTTSAALPKSVTAARTAGALRLTGNGEVQVYIAVNDFAEIDDLVGLGASIERTSEELGIVQAWVPVNALRTLSGLPSVEGVRLPDYPHLNEGSVETEGNAVLKSDQLRSALGVDGTGVTIGVISDGVAGLATSQGSGDLPAVDTSTCNVAGGNPGADGAEGTAMLEIVHDIAPGASLMFGYFGFGNGGTALDFNAAVSCLAANADIVVDDIGWFGVGPYDGTGFVSQNTADALNGPGPIMGYFTAAGNQAKRHYQEPYVDSGTVLTGAGIVANPALPPDDTWVQHEFDESAGPKGTVHAGAEPAPAPHNRVVLQPGGVVTIVLVWDDPWGTAPNDYDLFIREDGDVLICSGDFQDSGPNSLPVESCSWENTGSGDLELDIIIGNFLDQAAPVEFDMFLLCKGCNSFGNGNWLDFNTAGSSVPNQSDAGGSPASVISVGAVRHSTPNDIESFSSRGLTEDGRLKPDIVAPDGVSVTGSGGFPSPFFGTSAAAPHAAAVAALLLECDPGLSRTELYDRMVLSAIDLGEPGPDNVYGYGRLNAVAAATGCAGAPAATPTPADTPTPTATDTPIATDTPTSTPTATHTPTDTPTPTPTDTPTPTFTPTPTPILVGDASCNGIVNALDATLILQFTAGLLSSLPCPLGADANGDGGVNSIDSVLVLQLVAGLLPGLPP